MRKSFALAICAPLVLIGAAYPDQKGEYSASPDGAESAAAPVTYRPCRPGPGDDRCIQLYERGVRASYARWLRDRGARDERTEVAAVGGPAEPAPTARPSRHDRAAADHRCHHPGERDGEAHGM